MAVLASVNVGSPAPNPHKTTGSTGIGKLARAGAVQVRDPGPKTTGLGSGIVGDYIGDGRHHGGSDQAVYAVAREVLDAWEGRLGRSLPNGFFGENLTTRGLEVDDAVIGERWRIGDTVELVVTVPRIPCSTFRGWVGEKGWLKTFTADARPGTYLAVRTPGVIHADDEIRVVHRPDHGVTVSAVFRALTTEKHRLPELAAAGEHLTAELAETVAAAIDRAQPAAGPRP